MFGVTERFLAHKTSAKIESCIEKDQGSLYRRNLGILLPQMTDAYRGSSGAYRKHLGASIIGRKCAREIWYTFRWWRIVKHPGRLLRLFNRGHLEEGRVLSILLTIGCQVWFVDGDGKQFKITGGDGHFGGSLDIVLKGIPDLPKSPMLGEVKTHSEKSFQQVKSKGVRTTKFEHYVQMQLYMGGYSLAHGLYIAVNKNTDELYLEIISFDQCIYSSFMDRALGIIASIAPPARLSKEPSWYECRFCSYKEHCHDGVPPEKNCRTCSLSKPASQGRWICPSYQEGIPEMVTQEGCEKYALFT